MSYRFIRQSRRAIFGACLAATCGGFYACTDNYDLDKPGNNPEWLGQSIYAELKNPNSSKLTGTFNNYLRLIDDLGETEILSKTGSKTVFAANDSAFANFFKNNSWGVTKYEDLTTAMKKQLLYSSMLDNALLVEMLSNVSNGDNAVSKGVAMKHLTSANVIDTIYSVFRGDMPENNPYWSKYYGKGLSVVMDNTRPMMVHFTNEQMVTNSITTDGAGSDFAIITGKPYKEGMAFIYKDQIVNADVTCQNGYIHQMADVIVPPGNLAQMLRNGSDTKLFSRMLDRFSAPYYDGATTANYINYLYQNNIQSAIDSIYQWRYFSSRSQGNSELNQDPDNVSVPADELLPYDPGWNQYYTSGSSDLADMAAMFVPTDSALADYFISGGGKQLIEQFANGRENNRANLEENIDSIPKNIVCAFLSNLMKSSFIQSVPSKFSNILDDASDPMGISVNDLHRSGNAYDVRIANNGVAYMMNKVYAPAKYVAVSAPALFDKSLQVINWAIQDKSQLGVNFYAYLLAMGSNFCLFLPDDAAFGDESNRSMWYVDPASLATTTPRALQFYYDNKAPYIHCVAWKYDPVNHQVLDQRTASNPTPTMDAVKTQFVDILNYHTLVLNKGQEVGGNHYYKTKHGGEVYITDLNNAQGSGEVAGGAQINGSLPPARITRFYDQREQGNGVAYRLNHLIQAPQTSVYSVLNPEKGNTQFSDFFELCSTPDANLMSWLGISSTTQKKYEVFVKKGLDMNVKFFNSYNYTVYAPDNDAMKIARSKGLPTWEQVDSIYQQVTDGRPTEEEEAQAKAKAFSMVEAINNFIRYHVQDNSVYVDNDFVTDTKNGDKYQTACSDSTGKYNKLTINGQNGVMRLTDNSGHTQTISTTSGLLVNKMTRDYEFNGLTISTSSFAVVHEISQPLNFHKNGAGYDEAWKSNSPAYQQRRMARWKKFLYAQEHGLKFY